MGGYNKAPGMGQNSGSSFPTYKYGGLGGGIGGGIGSSIGGGISGSVGGGPGLGGMAGSDPYHPNYQQNS